MATGSGAVRRHKRAEMVALAQSTPGGCPGRTRGAWSSAGGLFEVVYPAGDAMDCSVCPGKDRDGQGEVQRDAAAQ